MFDSIVLGLIQGLTEFLPVSSSGHLVIFSKLLGKMGDGTLFDILLHFGTLLATTLVFRKEISGIIIGIFKKDKEALQKAAYIIIACIPTGLIGILFKDPLEALFENPFLVSCTLLFTGSLLFITRYKEPGDKKFDVKSAFIIGLVQGFAIIPGISRSGSTIAAAMLLGRDRKEAGEFSFLISIPAILGAVLLKTKDVINDPALSQNIGIAELVGVLVAFISGVIALKWLLIFVQKGKLHFFSPYVWMVGIIGIIIFS